MFAFLKKIKIPKTTLTCLVILAIVLVALYFTGFINKDKLPFEHYEDDSCPPEDKSIACNIKRAYNIATS
tara:strand:+ start:429 stop:638 length:210 start_codon:yes stop_codon:yes gene_type:complete